MDKSQKKNKNKPKTKTKHQNNTKSKTKSKKTSDTKSNENKNEMSETKTYTKSEQLYSWIFTGLHLNLRKGHWKVTVPDEILKNNPKKYKKSNTSLTPIEAINLYSEVFFNNDKNKFAEAWKNVNILNVIPNNLIEPNLKNKDKVEDSLNEMIAAVNEIVKQNESNETTNEANQSKNNIKKRQRSPTIEEDENNENNEKYGKNTNVDNMENIQSISNVLHATNTININANEMNINNNESDSENEAKPRGDGILSIRSTHSNAKRVKIEKIERNNDNFIDDNCSIESMSMFGFGNNYNSNSDDMKDILLKLEAKIDEIHTANTIQIEGYINSITRLSRVTENLGMENKELRTQVDELKEKLRTKVDEFHDW